MDSQSITEMGIFLAAQTLAAVAGFFTLRADVKNLKGWVKDISKDTKAAAIHIAGLPCQSCKQLEAGD